MKTVISVLVFMLCIFIPLLRNVKKQLEDNQRPPRKRGQLGGAEAEAETPYGVDDLGEPYFSYEYAEPSAPAAPRTNTRPQPATASIQPQQAVAVENAPAFDLRQAVIYQTVLSNPYISEINQQNQ